MPIIDIMLTLKITSYFIGPAEAGNSFGGITPNSPRQLSGSAYNNYTKGVVKYFETETSQSHYINFDGVPPQVSWSYVNESQYSSSIAEYDLLIGTTTGSFVWEKEEFTQ